MNDGYTFLRDIRKIPTVHELQLAYILAFWSQRKTKNVASVSLDIGFFVSRRCDKP